jgi:hypothetical protein
MTTETINFTRVSNDINGNPRYVCHFLNLLNDKDEEEIREDFRASLAINPLRLTEFQYNRAVEKARKIGGKKFHNKQYGGGIVFQSYNIHETERQILELQSK